MKRTVLVVLVLSIAALAAAAPDDARVYDGHLPGAEPEDVGIVQVFDAATGMPVEGVSVRLHLEWAGTGFTGADLLGRTATDAFGLASVAWPFTPSDGHWVFEKAGYAVTQAFGSFPPDRVWLRKGETVSVRILDPFGRPAAGVTAEMILGCSHSPTVRIARTDAEGVLRLHDVEPGEGRVWIRMPGARTESFDIPPDGGTIAMDPGISFEGTVVDIEGEPVEGVVVASLQSPRGPTAVTGEKGTFRLDGVEPEGEVWFFHESWYGSERPFLVLTDVDLPAMTGPRPPLRLVLPPETVEDEDEVREFLAPKAFAAPILVVDAKTKKELPDVPLILISLTTGLGILDEEEEDEDYELTGRRIVHVEPGEYLVSPGSPFEPYRIASPTRVTIGAAPKEPIVAEVVPQPVLEVQGLTDAMEDGDFVLILPHASESLSLFDLDDPVHLPAGVEAVVRVEFAGALRYFPVGPEKDGVRRVTVEPAAPRPSGEEEIELSPDLPPLRLLGPDGKPLAGRAVRVFRHHASSRGATDDDGTYDSRWRSVTVTGGGPSPSPIAIEVEGWLPRVVVVKEPGDLTIRYPAGVIEMGVASPDGTPLDFAWCVDGMTGKGKGGKLTLRGVPPGRRTVVVGAKGFPSRLYVVDVPGEGAAKLQVVLSR